VGERKSMGHKKREEYEKMKRAGKMWLLLLFVVVILYHHWVRYAIYPGAGFPEVLREESKCVEERGVVL
jgi:hypothetical protein